MRNNKITTFGTYPPLLPVNIDVATSRGQITMDSTPTKFTVNGANGNVVCVTNYSILNAH